MTLSHVGVALIIQCIMPVLYARLLVLPYKFQVDYAFVIEERRLAG